MARSTALCVRTCLMESGISWSSWWGPLGFLASLTTVLLADCLWILWTPFTSMERCSCRRGLDQTSRCPWVWRAQLPALVLLRWSLEKTWCFSLVFLQVDVQKLRLYCDPLQSDRETACEIPSVVSFLISNVSYQSVSMITPPLIPLGFSLHRTTKGYVDSFSSSAKGISTNSRLFRCCLSKWNLLFCLVMRLCAFPQCPSTRVAPEDECDCVVGPPGQRGLPGRMVAHQTLIYRFIKYKDDFELIGC